MLGFAAGFAMPPIFVDLLLPYCLFSSVAAGASVNAPGVSIGLGAFFFIRRILIFWFIFFERGPSLFDALESACIVSMIAARCVPSLMRI